MAERCGTCGQSRPLELEMTVRGGRRLTMVSCPRCELRTWLIDGKPADISDVLKAAAGNPEFALAQGGGRPRGARRS